MDKLLNSKLRMIPSIDNLLSTALRSECLSKYPPKVLTQSLREVANEARRKIQNGEQAEITKDALLAGAELYLAKTEGHSLHRVINATGVILHTNLGRAPLSQRAKMAVEEIVSGYSNLEYNIKTGQRGSRYDHVTQSLCKLTGAQDALVVNNNAAAILLVLSFLAGSKKEVIVSRGELVEIGGSFRIPDVLTQSGARLVEVGTTNKTHLSDYEKAITSQTAAILKVHTSNYRIVGFASCPQISQLAGLGARYGIPLVEDLGSGTLVELGVGDEPTVKERLDEGVDIVSFSGDKLLGAGQAGIILGKEKYISPLKKHPLLRALRIDKLSLAALEGTLKDYQFGRPFEDIPVLSMLCASHNELSCSARRLLDALQPLEDEGWQLDIICTDSKTGGGSLPTACLESFALAVAAPGKNAAFLEERLRERTTPIIARIDDNKVIMDVRCLSSLDIEEIALAFKQINANLSCLK